jgi:putative transposase
MIDPAPKLSVSRQAIVLRISRGSVYYQPRPVSDANLKLMHRIDKLHMEFPFADSRMLQGLLVQQGFKVGRLHVATLMKPMGVKALHRKTNSSKPVLCHKIHPYLLRKLAVTRPNHAWAMDITYIPMAQGFIYLAAILDWFTRGVLSWRASITLEADFCIEALEEALARHGQPEIFNTDHPLVVCRQTPAQQRDSQFTSAEFIEVLASQKIKISMPLGDCRQSPAGNGRQRGPARQRLRRAAVADHQIRGGLPAGLRRRLRGPGIDRPLPWLPQQPPPAFVA